MSMPTPFSWLPVSSQGRAFALLSVVALVLMGSLQISGAPLKTDVAPSGIVTFELAGVPTQAEAILQSWGPEGRVSAGLNLGLDFAFIVAYVCAIGLGCVLVGCRLSSVARPFAVAGIWLAWAQFVAGMLDCIENYCLIRLLLGSRDAWMPALARACAILKFGIVGIGILYVLIGAVVVLALRIFRRPARAGESLTNAHF